LHSGTYTFLTAPSISGTFQDVNRLSVVFNQNVVYSPTAVDLVLAQSSTLAESPTVYPEIANVAIDDAQSANDTVMTHLAEGRLEAAMEGMRVAGGYHRVGYGDGSSPYGAWATGVGGFGSTSGSGSTPGYDRGGGGLMTGIDTQVAPGLAAGVAVEYSRTSVDEKGGGSGTITTPRLLGYGTWWVGPVAFDATIGVGYANLSSSRPIAAVGSASTSFNGLEATSALQASTLFSIDRFEISPAAGIQYALYDQHSFAESSSTPGYALRGLSKTVNSARPYVSLTAATRFVTEGYMTIEPKLSVTYQAEVAGTNRQIDVQAPGDLQVFTFNGISPSRSEIIADAGVNIETSRDLGYYADVGVIRSGPTNGMRLDAGVRYRF
jgi:outer membrane autotransporter protein